MVLTTPLNRQNFWPMKCILNSSLLLEYIIKCIIGKSLIKIQFFVSAGQRFWTADDSVLMTWPLMASALTVFVSADQPKYWSSVLISADHYADHKRWLSALFTLISADYSDRFDQRYYVLALISDCNIHQRSSAVTKAVSADAISNHAISCRKTLISADDRWSAVREEKKSSPLISLT